MLTFVLPGLSSVFHPNDFSGTEFVDGKRFSVSLYTHILKFLLLALRVLSEEGVRLPLYNPTISSVLILL